MTDYSPDSEQKHKRRKTKGLAALTLGALMTVAGFFGANEEANKNLEQKTSDSNYEKTEKDNYKTKYDYFVNLQMLGLLTVTGSWIYLSRRK